MSSPPRKTLKLNTSAPARDPRRRPVRPGPVPVGVAGAGKGGGAGKGSGAATGKGGGTSQGPAGGARSSKPPADRAPAPRAPGQRAERTERGEPAAAPGRPKRSPGPFGPGAPKTGPKPAGSSPRAKSASAWPARPDQARPAKPTGPMKPPPRPAVPRPPAPRASEPRAPAALVPATEGIRLSKRLADQGVASRREADEWIEAGWVRVDGKLAVLGQRVLPHQQVEIDPAAHRSQAQRVTILLHKPIGYVSGQAEDGHEPASVLVTPANHWSGDGSRIAFHPGQLRGLAPAGRLDIDSTGLLVLTQDGRIAKLLIGEDSRVEKEYLVRVEPMAEGSVQPDALALLNHGLSLDEQPLKPAKVSWQNEHQLRFVLREGRKRQIRRMCELVGYKVTALKRVRIGSIVLGALPPGQWRYLGPHEKFI